MYCIVVDKKHYGEIRRKKKKSEFCTERMSILTERIGVG